jgi:proteasome accessory factor B
VTERLERLTNLAALLLETRRPLSIDEVLEQVPGYPEDHPSARRQFERDKDTLRGIGIPVRTEFSALGSEVGYMVDRKAYALPTLDLTPAELAALHVAVTAVRLEGGVGTGALAAVGGAEGDAAATIAELPTVPALPVLSEACRDRATVRFVHRGERRTLDPWGLLFRRGNWYVVGHDHDRREERSFRIDRIEGDVEVGAAGEFEPPRDARPAELLSDEPWRFGDDETEEQEARLLVSTTWAPVVLEQLGEDAVVERREDGGVVFAVPVTNPAAFRSFALDLLDEAEILEPPELRAAFVGWLDELAAR